MPGEESGAGRIKAPDLYRVKGSLPIPNHTMQGDSGSIGGDAGGIRKRDLKIEDGLTMG
jgi:hypothetical protein